METKHLDAAVARLSALSQHQRLAAFRALVATGPAGLSAGALAEHLALPASTLSFHLAQLANAGLVHRVRAGRSLIYTADFTAMRNLVAFLTENCCGGADCSDQIRGQAA